MHANGSESDKNGASILIWIGRNPAAGATALYIWVSTVGSVYEWALLKAFGINVFDFAGPGDFLLAAFRQPYAIGLAILGLVFIDSSRWFDARVRARYKRKTQNPPYSSGIRRMIAVGMGRVFASPYSVVAFVVFYTLLPAGYFGTEYARYLFASLPTGLGERVHIELVARGDSVVALPDSGTTLLATTSDFLFLYRSDTFRAYVVPRSSLRQMAVCPSTELAGDDTRLRALIRIACHRLVKPS
jgi:hypothetical protein